MELGKRLYLSCPENSKLLGLGRFTRWCEKYALKFQAKYTASDASLCIIEVRFPDVLKIGAEEQSGVSVREGRPSRKEKPALKPLLP